MVAGPDEAQDPFWDKIQRVRNTELSILWRTFVIDATNVFLLNAIPTVVSVGTFSIYVLAGNRLTAAKAPSPSPSAMPRPHTQTPHLKHPPSQPAPDRSHASVSRAKRPQRDACCSCGDVQAQLGRRPQTRPEAAAPQQLHCPACTPTLFPSRISAHTVSRSKGGCARRVQ